MITDNQRRYIFDLVTKNKEFETFLECELWDADYPDVIRFLRSKFPGMTFPDDINDLTVNEASFLISYLKNV